MDVKAFPALIVGVVVALVLAGAVLPVFAETTDPNTTFENDGLIYMDKYGDDTNVTLFWDHTDPTNVTVNGEKVALNTSAVITVSTGLNWLIRSSPNNMTFFSPVNVIASVSDGTDLTVTMSGGTVTATNTASTPATATSTYTDVYVITADKGDYVMKSPTKPAYVNADSLIVGSGMSVVGGNGGYGYDVVGTIDDGATVTQFRGTTTTNSDVTITYTEVNGYEDLYLFDKMTFTADSTNLTYNQVIVPTEITAEKSVHPDGPLTVILNVLPLLAIAGLVTGAVVWFINRKG